MDVPTYMRMGAIATVKLGFSSKNQIKVLGPPPNSTWKFLVCPRNSYKNSEFANKIQLLIWMLASNKNYGSTIAWTESIPYLIIVHGHLCVSWFFWPITMDAPLVLKIGLGKPKLAHLNLYESKVQIVLVYTKLRFWILEYRVLESQN